MNKRFLKKLSRLPASSLERKVIVALGVISMLFWVVWIVWEQCKNR